jgi:hypothetical protein
MSFNFLRGISGEIEIGRVLLASGGAAAIFAPIVFIACDMIFHGAHFDIVAFCASYPVGLAALSGVGVYAIGKKEQSVATAKATLQASDTAAATASTIPMPVNVQEVGGEPVKQ